jgi:hypothetical protein
MNNQLGSRIMKRAFILGCFGLAGSGAACWAQVQNPVLGYVPDGGSIRTMYGIPASGAIGPAASVARDLAHIALAPGGDFAVAVTADNGQPVVVSLGGNAAQISSVMGAAAGADNVVLSPGGSVAVVLTSSSGAIQVLSGLPGSVTVTRNIDTSLAGGTPVALAVSDDGQWVVGASASGVYAYGPSGQTIPLPVSGAVTALAFLNGKQDIVVTTSTTVTLIADIGGAVAPTVLFAPPPGTPPPPESPMALAVSADNNHVVLVEPSGGIGHINRATGAVSIADCQCAPTGLFSLGGSVFRLTGVDGGAAKVFDASSDSVWFVPQALEIAQGSAQ